MKKVIECPYCDGHATLTTQLNELSFRKEFFKVNAHFYKCNQCSEEFTTTETDTFTLLQAHHQYREKYSILFPEQIIALRMKYKLSATKMSEVLGLGTNGYGNYEKGEIPTPAIANLIFTANNLLVFKQMLEKAKECFNDGMFETALSNINNIINLESTTPPFGIKLNNYNIPNSWTGYKIPNKEKLAGILVAFITRCKTQFNDRVKLNKLLFYSDFLSYEQTGFSITGLSYRAIQFGPVPTNYENIYAYMQDEEYISSNIIENKNGTVSETFTTDLTYDCMLFNKNEQNVIDTITEKFKETSTWDLVELSHTEKGWLDLHNQRLIINYQTYAFSLVGI